MSKIEQLFKPSIDYRVGLKLDPRSWVSGAAIVRTLTTALRFLPPRALQAGRIRVRPFSALTTDAPAGFPILGKAFREGEILLRVRLAREGAGFRGVVNGLAMMNPSGR